MDSFFGIGFPELVLILIVAGIVMGPERIGQTARWLGRITAQMQKISREFVRQLNHELDGSSDGQAVKETMQELQQLRKELSDLRGEVAQTTNRATKAGKQAVEDIQNSIQPPNMKMPKVPAPPSEQDNSQSRSAGKQNGATEGTAVPQLPTPLEIPDDPE